MNRYKFRIEIGHNKAVVSIVAPDEDIARGRLYIQYGWHIQPERVK